MERREVNASSALSKQKGRGGRGGEEKGEGRARRHHRQQTDRARRGGVKKSPRACELPAKVAKTMARRLARGGESSPTTHNDGQQRIQPQQAAIPNTRGREAGPRHPTGGQATRTGPFAAVATRGRPTTHQLQ